jgi:cell wall-associated NlpC family hydrolase
VNFPTPAPARRTAALVAALAVLASLVAGHVTAAAADPIADKKAEAARLAARLEEEAVRVSMLTEELNAARVAAERLAADLAAAEAGVAAAKERVAAVRARLKGQAVDAYVQGGGLRSVELLVGGGEELAELPVRATYLRTATSAALDTLDALHDERARLEEEQIRVAAARGAADEALAAVESRHVDARAAVRRQEATLATVKGELTELVAAEERRRAEEEARRVQAELEARRREAAAREAAAREAARRETARSQPPSARATTTDPNAGSGPAASGAAAAVEEARRQLGKPYQYGAAGPDTFDCSGLTQWSWKAGGKALPHSSRAQYGATSRVALPNIKPGDLAFFGPSVSGIHHVGIYVGDGRMIEASRTGTPVRYASIYRSDMVGIGRVN